MTCALKCMQNVDIICDFGVQYLNGFHDFLRLLPCWSYRVVVRLRWLNAVFDTSVSFTFFSKTLDPSVIKNGSKQVHNTVQTFF